jgi:DNA polymerase III gamma/tau subunit
MTKENFLKNKQIRKIYDLAVKKAVPHAILFESGNKNLCIDVAVNIAKTLMCQDKQNTPCNNCDSCAKISGNIHPDIEIIKPQNNQKTIGIDTIRLLKQTAYVIPNESDYKIYIFPDAHIITPQAQNAFLKILEEPPKSVIFIMICSSMLKLLDTVISRLTCFKIYGGENEVDADIFTESEKFIENLLNKNELEILKITSGLSKDRSNFTKFLEYLKNLLIENYTANNGGASRLTNAQIISILNTLKKCENLIQKNINMPLLSCYLCSNLMSALG